MARVGFGLAVWLRDGGSDAIHRALDEIALAGFDGVELNDVERWYDRPRELERLLGLHGLSLSSSYVSLGHLDADAAEAEYRLAQRRIEFLAELGAGVLLLDGGRPAPPPGPALDAAVETVARRATRIAEYARRNSVACCWHQHWGTIFEREAPFARFLELTDPELVGFCPDTAQLALGGFDVYETLERYAHRVGFVHFKDLAPNRDAAEASDTGAYGLDSRWRFVELGRGIVDFPRAWSILRSAGYDGWIVDDLDYSAYPGYESALACRRYLAEGLGV